MDNLFLQKFNVNENEMQITFSCASDIPYLKYDQDRNTNYYQILKMDESAIDFSRLQNYAPVLWQHDTQKQIGVVEKAYLLENKIMVQVKFRKNDEFSVSVFKDILDGTIKNISVGYVINHYTEEKRNGEYYRIVDNYLIYEVSIVSVPADNTVGIRSLYIGDKTNMEIEDKIKQLEETVQTLKKQLEVTEQTIAEQTVAEQTVEEQTVEEQTAEESAELTIEEKEEIEQIAKDFGVSEERKQSVLNKKISVREFKNQILNKKQEKKQMNKNFREFLVNGAKGQKSSMELRDFNGLTGGAIGTETTEFAKVLEKKLGIQGYRVMSGLTSNVSIPVLKNRFDIAETDLNGEATTSANTFESRILQPKKFVGQVVVGEDLLLQANDDVEAFVIDTLTAEIAAKVQAYMLKKAKEYAKKAFIFDDVKNVKWSDILTQEGEIGGYMVNPAYVLSASARATLKGIQKAEGTAQFICDGDNKINGYDANVSGCTADNTLYFGDWSHLVLGVFGGGLDIIIDPYTFSSQGAVKIVASMRADATVDSNDAFAFGVLGEGDGE